MADAGEVEGLWVDWGIGEVVGADGLEGRLFLLDGGGGGGVEFGLGVVGLGEAEGGLFLEILA